MECVELLDNLSQKEKNKILSVLKRDERLQNSQEKKIRDLRHEIQIIRSRSILRSGDDQNKICLRCRQSFGLLFNRGTLCPVCRVKVCKDCQEFLFNGSWLCSMCFKQRQLKWLTGEWAIGHDENPLRKWASGSDLIRASMQLRPICTGSIDVDDPSPNQVETRTRKPAQNGVHSSEQGAKSRLNCPKEGDQHRLSQLFGVLRTRKPDDGSTQRVSQTEIKRVTSRKYSDSDSESSTSSNGDEVSVRSSPNTAMSLTESELDARRLESPQYSDTSSPRGIGSPIGSESPKRLISPDKSDESPEKDRRGQKYRTADRSTKAGSRGDNLEPLRSPVQLNDEPVDPDRVVRPKVRPRAAEKGQRPRGHRSPGKTGEKNKQSNDVGDNDKDLLQVDSSLQLHVSRTRESLDKKQEALLSRSRNSMESPVTSGSASPSGSIGEKEQARKNLDNLSVRSGQSEHGKAQHKKSNESLSVDRISRNSGQDTSVDLRTPTEGAMHGQGRDISMGHVQDTAGEGQTYIADIHQPASDVPSDRTQSIPASQTVGDDTSQTFLQVPRSGSPYSVSMESLPSSHPSPTTVRSIGGDSSLIESSDTDSVSRYSHMEHSGTESAARDGSEEDFVVEEISKIRFKTFTKKIVQAGALAKLSKSPNKSPNRNVATDEAGQRDLRVGEEGRADYTSSFVNISMTPFIQVEKADNQHAGNDTVKPVIQEENNSSLKPTFNNLSRQGHLQEKIEQNDISDCSKITRDLSWFNEFEKSRQLNDKPDKKIFKNTFGALPTHLTSSVSSEKDRVASTDSMEGMIDNMAKQFIYSNEKRSVSTSVSSDPFTPVSPIESLKQEKYEVGTDKYKFVYDISDDNLETAEEGTEQQNNNINKPKHHDEIRDELKTFKRGKFTTNSSLDSLIDDSFGDSDIEREFQDALEISDLKSCDVSDDETGNEGKTYTTIDLVKEQQIGENAASIRTQIETLTHRVLEGKSNSPNEISYPVLSRDKTIDELISVSNNSTENKVENFDHLISPRNKKVPLKKEDSLDTLLHEQGDNVDASMEVIELDEEVMAALYADMSIKSAKPSEISTVSYLGVQMHTATDKPLLYQYKISPDIGITDDEFDAVFGEAAQQMGSKEGSCGQGKASSSTKQVPFGYAALKEGSDTSDSDMLSAIEEEDENDEEDKDSLDDYVKQDSNFKRLNTIPDSQVIPLSKVSETVPNESKNIKEPLKGKIFQKVHDMERKTKLQTQTNSPKSSLMNKVDNKNQEKYKKLKDRWQAIERHEANLLDFEDDQQNAGKDIEVQDEDSVDFGEKVNASSHVIKTRIFSEDKCDEADEIENESENLKTVEEKRTMVGDYMPESGVDEMCGEALEDIIEKECKTDNLSMEKLMANLDLIDCKNEGTKEHNDSYHRVQKSVEMLPITSDEFYNSQFCSNSQLHNKSIQDHSDTMSQNTKENEINTGIIDYSNSLLIMGGQSSVIQCTNSNDAEVLRTENIKEENSNFRKSDKTDISNDDFSTEHGSKQHIESEFDRNYTCRSIADIESDYSPGNLPKVIVEGCAVTMRGNIDKHESYHLDHTPSIHSDVRECKSIEVGEPDIFYNVAEDEDVCYSLEEDLGALELNMKAVKDKTVQKMFPAQINLKVIPGDDESAEPQLMPLTRLSNLKSKPAELTRLSNLKGALSKPAELHEPSALFAKDDANVVTGDTQCSAADLPYSSSPLTMSEPFKTPEAPPRTKRTLSSASSTSSAYSSEIMDSPRSGKMLANRDSPQTVSESSISQDDSGHVSGGSCGNTPEHRRTGSSYSQSSLPSTLSTVTDQSEEEEDIDKVVALQVSKKSSSRGNLLSVIADSRESIASFYSDAGSIGHSNIPVTGEILFGINYNYKTGMLEVAVKQCRDIAVADSRRRRTDPYVKCYLLPDKTRGGKRKTKVKKHTVNPFYDETLKYSISKSELENRTLWVTVWHNDRFGRNDFLGEVTINFDYYKFTDPTPLWYSLQERMDSTPSSMMVYKGDISLRIRYVPPDKVETSPQHKGKQKKDSGKGQLQVLVKEARNLTAVRANGSSDPFCKAYLLPERHKSSKQKTFVVKKNCNPVWNHTFVFENVNPIELRERSLELTIWDFEKLSSNDFLGGVRLNLGTGLSASKPVEWMDARGEEMSMWQAMLDRPNLWIDGALILRPNMDKRKF